jgi:hypothetical protein
VKFPLAVTVLVTGSVAWGWQDASSAGATAAASAPRSDQTFFPSDWLRGYGTFEFAPPHNEPDLGRCSSLTGHYGGANAQCAAFARYVLSGYLEAQPFGHTPLRHLFLFAAPRSDFGNNVPQVSYTGSFTPIAFESLFGAGYELPKNFEVRVVHHAVYWLGRYENNLGPADLGGAGPYGDYTTLGVRWHFHGTHESQPSASADRTFFPHNWLRGYGTFEVALPHNEVDLGRCNSSIAQLEGASAPCAAFARYVLSGYLEAQPFGRTPLRHVFLFASPRADYGNNVPPVSYTASFTPIAFENLYGAGVTLPKNFDVRVTQHAVYWIGRYSNNLGSADRGFTGPYGLYTTVGVRWHFGGIHEAQ